MLVNKVCPKKKVQTSLDIMLSNCSWGNQAQLKQSCSFYGIVEHSELTNVYCTLPWYHYMKWLSSYRIQRHMKETKFSPSCASGSYSWRATLMCTVVRHWFISVTIPHHSNTNCAPAIWVWCTCFEIWNNPPKGYSSFHDFWLQTVLYPMNQNVCNANRWMDTILSGRLIIVRRMHHCKNSE